MSQKTNPSLNYKITKTTFENKGIVIFFTFNEEKYLIQLYDDICKFWTCGNQPTYHNHYNLLCQFKQSIGNIKSFKKTKQRNIIEKCLKKLILI